MSYYARHCLADWRRSACIASGRREEGRRPMPGWSRSKDPTAETPEPVDTDRRNRLNSQSPCDAGEAAEGLRIANVQDAPRAHKRRPLAHDKGPTRTRYRGWAAADGAHRRGKRKSLSGTCHKSISCWTNLSWVRQRVPMDSQIGCPGKCTLVAKGKSRQNTWK